MIALTCGSLIGGALAFLVGWCKGKGEQEGSRATLQRLYADLHRAPPRVVDVELVE